MIRHRFLIGWVDGRSVARELMRTSSAIMVNRRKNKGSGHVVVRMLLPVRPTLLEYSTSVATLRRVVVGHRSSSEPIRSSS